MNTWAEKEIEIACARERATGENESDYGVACYQSALKAFKSLTEDGHSGFSIVVTKNILNRLIEGKPLTPIEDTPDIWEEVTYLRVDSNVKKYQCTRMSSLFKDVYPDGTVKYHDVGRTVVTYVDNPDIHWTNGAASRIIDEMFPITMPYMPASKQYVISAEDFLVNSENGDYDTVAYISVVTPDGNRVQLNQFYKEVGGEMVKIGYEEFEGRKLMAHTRMLKEKDTNENI